MSYLAVAIASSVAAPIIGGYMGSQASQSAANTSAESANRSADMQYQQYLQNRQDLMPWMDVARGDQQRLFTPDQFDPNNPQEMVSFAQALMRGEVDRQGFEIDAEGNRVGGTGALGELADYGRSDVLTGDYVPASEIPEFAPGSNIRDFNVAGNQPEYNRLTDITQDPSYQFRKEEQDRAINRNMAGMGKLMSGNRLEELMARSGDLASQEYGNAYNRNVQDYEINRGREATGYARDVTGFDQNRLAEEARYGRDLTAYNAAASQEALGYGRGVDAYGRAYGEESDYLNRLANLSNVGQNTATNMAGLGINAANAVGANIVAAGNAQAAGQLGSASAWTGALGDLTSLGTQYIMSQPTQQNYTTPPGYGGTSMTGWDYYGA